tara:strand:+ start:1272 stop:2075 length:804 start_codon:yes stop_codon:yes gene_type:complete
MNSSLIKVAFNKAKSENRPALITYIVAGDNNKKNSFNILKSISKYVDICEIGFPHNTPIGDGGEIQTSSYRSIKNGFRIKDVFEIVKKFKKIKNSKPVILMGYYNMIFQFGEKKFLDFCKSSGVDGLIVVDLPWPENKKFSKKCYQKNINFIQLISPLTSKKRIKNIVSDSHDMIYYISMLSTTGGKLKVSPRQINRNYNNIKKLNKNKKCVIGFGITEKSIKKLRFADGLVVGSAICKEITRSLKKGQNPVTNVSKKVRILKSKII